MGISKEPQANEETPTKNYANQPSHHALSHIILPRRLAVLLDFRSRLFAQFRNERIHPINEPHVMIRDQGLNGGVIAQLQNSLLKTLYRCE